MRTIFFYLISFVFFVAMIFISISCKDVIVNEIKSPNNKIIVKYDADQGFNVYYDKSDSIIPIFRIASIGLSSDNNADSCSFKFVDISDQITISESYQMLSGKRKFCFNEGVEQTFHFENSEKTQLDVIFRVYNDGIAFRYHFPNIKDTFNVSRELTSYKFSSGIKRWTQKLNSAYEDFYVLNTDGGLYNGDAKWGFPALFEVADSVYTLFSEANIMRGNCGSWLSNFEDRNIYSIEMAESDIQCDQNWYSPWRVVIIGSLADIVESTLITDVSEPCKISDTSWIMPGLVSWIYWANNHGSKDFQIVKKYIDFASDLKLPYVLIDWEWDEMSNGGDLMSALKYSNGLNIRPLLWYNSSTAWCGAGPLFRLNSKEKRQKEFLWLNEIGVKGIKVDFFNQDSVATMNYFIDILEDAADKELLVNFHGATIPRGWQRTYPNLVSVEGVYGAEWYNNDSILTDSAAWHNCTLPFTRNVVGPMDYTPCTFTDSQYPHITSNGHELALLVVFESTLQHLADRPEGYKKQPMEVQNFISQLPTVWDDTKLIDGYPSKYILIARRSGKRWFIAGLNGTNESQDYCFNLNFVTEDISSITLFKDGKKCDEFEIEHADTTNKFFRVKCLPHGGFVMSVILND